MFENAMLFVVLSVVINMLCVSVYTRFLVYTNESEMPVSFIDRVFFHTVMGVCIGVGLPIIMTKFIYQYDSMLTGILLIGIFYVAMPYFAFELSYSQAQKQVELKKAKKTIGNVQEEKNK